jgi:ATP-binding cassette subfamily B protein
MIEKIKYGIVSNCAYMIKLAWRYNKNVLWVCAALAALYVASGLLALYFAPAVLGAIQTSPVVNDVLITILIFTAAKIIVNASISYIDTIVNYGRSDLATILKSRVMNKIATTSYPNTENKSVRKKFDGARSASNTTYGASVRVWDRMAGAVQCFLAICVYLAIIAVFEPWVIVIVFVTTFIPFIANMNIDGWRNRRRDEYTEYNQLLYYVIVESREHKLAKDIRIFGMGDWLQDMYSRGVKLCMSFNARAGKVELWTDIIELLFAFLRNGAAYIYLVRLVLNGGMGAPEFLLMFSAVGRMTGEFSRMFNQIRNINRDSMSISAMREFLDYDEPFKFEDGEPLEPQDTAYKIEFRSVSFRYQGAKADTLKNINLTIEPHEKLAVVGLNGAGKTTLIKLLCGFYDPTEGEVLLNGQDIRKYNRRDYYRHFTAVFQQKSIISTTIEDNITQGTGGDYAASAAKAGVAERIEKYPDKYQTHITKRIYSDGIELSGGETQRLLMARALHKNAPIMVLDEPTASLDPIAESDIYSRYGELTKGKTSVYISHRLASTRFCDRVIYMESGEITEEGSHDDLISKGGRYAELFELQSHYYKEGVSADG